MTSSQGEKRSRAKVEYDYDAGDDTQLTIRDGQILTVIGDATAEGWYLAETSNGKEGYVPKDYIKILGGIKPSGPPPNPGASSNRFSGEPKPKKKKKGGYKVDMGDDDGMIMEENDTWSLFAYQLEWFAIPCIFIGATLSFMYSTPQTQANKWRLAICSWFSILLAAFAAYICGYDRSRLELCGSSASVRAIVFFLCAFLLAFAYPVGIGSAAVSVAAFAVELQVHRLGCKELPSRVTDHWCSIMFGGTENCPPVKLIVFFATMAISGGVFGWGYIDGFNFAIQNNDAEPSYYLNKTANAFMFGFGRVITINLVFVLLLAARDLVMNCLGDRCNRRGDERHIPQFLHRCMGYSIVVSSFLHLICVYFVYEDSMATHTFLDTYGWSSFITGWVALFCLSLVVASSNDSLWRQNRKLWKMAQYPAAIVLVLVLIAHGGDWLSTYYWKIMVGPIVVYSIHAVVNYCKNH